VEGTARPPEDATGLTLAGRAWKNLAVGVSLKILVAQKANYFIPLNESATKTYKVAFDAGVCYSGLLPWTMGGFNQEAVDENRFRRDYGRPFIPGISLGLSFQNLGGKVEFNYVPYQEILPQTFRADLLWGAYAGSWWDLRVACQLQKLLVANNSTGGYQSATSSFFSAWGGGANEGGWTSRLGIESTAFCLLSVRMGWSVDHGASRSFTHAGLGTGPEWLRANFALLHEPGTIFTWMDGFRFDVTTNLKYSMIRRWMRVK
jgi:hypothetical protein